MFFIFGWNRATEHEHGNIFPIKCRNCHNTERWKLYQRKLWFELFFIPIIPYQSKYFLLCPICSRGVNITGEENIAKWKQVCRQTSDFMAGRMSKEQYMRLVEAKDQPLLK